MRVRAQLLDRLISQTGGNAIARSRVDARLSQARSALNDLTGNLGACAQLREHRGTRPKVRCSRVWPCQDTATGFDPLEVRSFHPRAGNAHDGQNRSTAVATVQRNLQRDLAAAEDDLVAQGRRARDLPAKDLRTRGDSTPLPTSVRRGAPDVKMGKQVRLNILGGTIENGPRHAGAHDAGLRASAAQLRGSWRRIARAAPGLGKPAVGTIEIVLSQEP